MVGRSLPQIRDGTVFRVHWHASGEPGTASALYTLRRCTSLLLDLPKHCPPCRTDQYPATCGEKCGLGATIDPSGFITNQEFAGAYPVSAPVTSSVGGKAAQVLFAGLTSPGLYLVRVALPSDLQAGPQPIQITAGGVRTRPSLMLMVGAP